MTSRARILIWTASPLCRNPRVVKEATSLGRAGYDVTVLTVAAVARFEEWDREILRNAPFKRTVIDLLGQSFSSRLANLQQRAGTKLARALCQHIGIETARALGPAGPLLRAAKRIPADLTIAHTEIPLWGLQALHLAGRRIAADLEDWYSEDLLPSDRAGRPVRLLTAAEIFALRHASYVSVPSACMAEALAKRHGGPPPLVLRNAFPLQPDPIPIKRDVTHPVRFIWFSQTIGPGRGLEEFIVAWAQTREPSQLILQGEPRPGYLDTLRRLVPAARQTDLVHRELVSLAELPVVLAECDIGLALEAATPPNRDIAVTNKILQYLSAGLALVATATAGQREIMQAVPACGLLIPNGGDPELTTKLDALIADRTGLHRRQQAARASAERDFCWEQEEPKLLASVARALAQPPPSSC